MYAKTQALPETIKVQSDNGSLRLQFSTKYNPIFDGKRKHQGLGMKDTHENWQKAIAIAYRIEGDLQHPDWQQLFDPTFAKYGLKTKYAAELKLAAPIPEPEPEMTVGAMWEEYLVWKQPQLQSTTYEKKFLRTYTNLIKGLVWENSKQEFFQTDKGITELPLSEVDANQLYKIDVAKRQIENCLSTLSEAFTRLQSQGKTKLTKNPFVLNKIENKTDMYQPIVNADGTEREWWDTPDTEKDESEKDRRCFNKSEMLTIIKAFHEAKQPAARQMAPLVEFRFLTGCRNGEAFALRWRDCFRGKDGNNIVFRTSYDGETKITKNTKTGDNRIFKMYPKLNDLLLRIKPADAKPTDLVFPKLNGKNWSNKECSDYWLGSTRTVNQVEYEYPGVVTQLTKTGTISGYLPFYACRHTFISLQAHAGTDLFLLATACGNSVEVIQKHYLGVNPDVSLADIF